MTLMLTPGEIAERVGLDCEQACGEVYRRVEQSWERNGDGDWVISRTHLVCGNNHRKLVELLP